MEATMSVGIPERLRPEVEALPSKAAMIRALRAAGYQQARIAEFLKISDQHVSNVLRRSEKAGIVPETLPGAPARSPSDPKTPVWLHIAPDGRVMIPTDLRAAMDLDTDGAVTAEIVDGALHLVSPRVTLRQLQTGLAPLKAPGESMVDAFLRERRAMWGEQ
ncbi:hypothetical protein DXV76_12210 [Rhodobacteraceae bacterium CCMM004]|nr:hypothetical protein DXV76_12210 [Rhodobacteraceae bacterium CCMM004]